MAPLHAQSEQGAWPAEVAPHAAAERAVEALLFAQVLRPLSAALGPLGDVLSGELATSIAQTHDA